MNKVIVRRGQNLLDLAIINTGDVTRCFEIAMLNNIPVSSDLNIEDEIAMPSNVINTDVVSIFNSKNQPATAFTEQNDAPQLGGIGYMRIGGNFKVS